MTDATPAGANLSPGTGSGTGSDAEPNGSQLLVQHAKLYIDRGWAVFLLATDSTKGKLPVANCPKCDARRGADPHDKANCQCLMCHGFHAATKELGRFEQMVQAIPDGYLAVRTGLESRLLVIDAEATSKNPQLMPGVDVLDEWERWAGFELPHPTLRARSVSGGVHLYFELPPDAGRIKSGRVLPNIDIKCEAAYVGVPCGRNDRVWDNPSTAAAVTSPEMLEWAVNARRGPRGLGGSTWASIGGLSRSGTAAAGNSGNGRSEGYDYEGFLSEGCPDGYRNDFMNELLFRGRKLGLDKEALRRLAEQHWEKLAQPPQARYEMPWHDVQYMLDRIWGEVEPDPPLPAWRPPATSAKVSVKPKNTLPVAPVKPREPDGQDEGPEGSRFEGEDTGVPDSGTADSGWRPPEPPLGEVTEWPYSEHATDFGNGLRYVRLESGRTRFVTGMKQWYLWDGSHWVRDQHNRVFERTKRVIIDIRQQAALSPDSEKEKWSKWALATESVRSRKALLETAAAEWPIAAAWDEMNRDPWALVVKNGTVDLRTGELRESKPSDLNTQTCNVVYDPDARCPNWEAHVELVSRHSDGSPDSSLATFIQRWAGYTLTGVTTEQKFLFAYGDGNNGKNALIETLLGILGSYGVRSSSKLLLGNENEHETIVARLAGARMAFMDETPKGKINEARIKELTGSGVVTARFMRQDYFEFAMQAKLWIAGNNKPRVDETSEGFWRRLDLVPFDTRIPPEQRVRDYAGVLKEEWPGILNWCLVGLKDYLELGSLGSPDRMRKASEEYREAEDLFGQFCNQIFETGISELVFYPNKVWHGELWKDWCKDQGLDKFRSVLGLKQDLERHGFRRDDTPRKVRWLSPVGNTTPGEWKSVRGWWGPPLKDGITTMLVWEAADYLER